MKKAFFGQYLLHQGIINAMQLTEAIVFQEKFNLAIGKLAENKGLLTPEQIKEVVELQKNEDLYFGEAAVHLKFLTSEGVEDLLKEQKQKHLYLGEALVQLGHLSEVKLKETLEDFATEQNEQGAVDENNYPEELRDEKPFVEEFSLFTSKLLQRSVGIIAKYKYCKFLGEEVRLLPIVVRIPFTGTLSGKVSLYTIMFTHKVARVVATKMYTKMGLSLDSFPTENGLISDTMMVADVIAELVNLIAGQVCAKISKGAELLGGLPEKDVSEGEEGKTYTLNDNEKAALVSLVTPHGTIPFFLLFSTTPQS